MRIYTAGPRSRSMSAMEYHAGPSTVSPTPEVIATCDPFQHAAIGMAFVTVDGRFLRVNPALCDLLGRDSDTLLRAHAPR